MVIMVMVGDNDLIKVDAAAKKGGWKSDFVIDYLSGWHRETLRNQYLYLDLVMVFDFTWMCISSDFKPNCFDEIGKKKDVVNIETFGKYNLLLTSGSF